MLPDFSDTRGTCVALPVSRVTVPHMPDNASVGSWREVHSNYPEGGGHFGTFLVLLPMGAAPHDDLVRDQRRCPYKPAMGAEFGAHGVREALAWGFDSSSRPPRLTTSSGWPKRHEHALAVKHGGRRFWQRLDKYRGLCASTRTRTEAWTPSTFLKGVPEMMVPQDTVNPSARLSMCCRFATH
jgi:hypothetical protein